jgi:hypothetical protein
VTETAPPPTETNTLPPPTVTQPVDPDPTNTIAP